MNCVKILSSNLHIKGCQRAPQLDLHIHLEGRAYPMSGGYISGGPLTRFNFPKTENTTVASS